MPTYTIGSDGGRNYANFASFAADIGVGISNDLVTDTENWTVDVYNDSGATVSTGSGASINPTTDATYNITIQAASGHGIADHFTASDALYPDATGAAHYTYTGTFSNGWSFAAPYTTLTGVQLVATGNRGGVGGMSADNGMTSGCIFHVTHTTAGNHLWQMSGSSAQATIENCLLIQDSDDRDALRIGFSTKYVNHCTIVRTNASSSACDGLENLGGTVVVKNTCSLAADTTPTDDFESGTYTGSAYNASTTTQAGTIGTNDQSSVTYTDQFEGASDFRAKSAGDLDGNGNNAGPATDIIGQTRASSSTIGCWELIAAGGGGGFYARNYYDHLLAGNG